MLAGIAAATEGGRPPARLRDLRARSHEQRPATAAEAIAGLVEYALETVPSEGVFVPTRAGTTARMISRFKPDVWVVALSPEAAVGQGLAFSYGVYPVQLAADPENWSDFACAWLAEHGIPSGIAMLVSGPSSRHPHAN